MLNMEALGTSKMLVPVFQITQCYSPGDCNVHKFVFLVALQSGQFCIHISLQRHACTWLIVCCLSSITLHWPHKVCVCLLSIVITSSQMTSHMNLGVT